MKKLKAVLPQPHDLLDRQGAQQGLCLLPQAVGVIDGVQDRAGKVGGDDDGDDLPLGGQILIAGLLQGLEAG